MRFGRISREVSLLHKNEPSFSAHVAMLGHALLWHSVQVSDRWRWLNLGTRQSPSEFAPTTAHIPVAMASKSAMVELSTAWSP